MNASLPYDDEWFSLKTNNDSAFLPLLAVFHTDWFLESQWLKKLVIQMILALKIHFIHNRALWHLAILTTLGIATETIILYTWIEKQLNTHHLPTVYYLWQGHDLRVYAA